MQRLQWQTVPDLFYEHIWFVRLYRPILCLTFFEKLVALGNFIKDSIVGIWDGLTDIIGEIFPDLAESLNLLNTSLSSVDGTTNWGEVLHSLAGVGHLG